MNSSDVAETQNQVQAVTRGRKLRPKANTGGTVLKFES